MLKIISNGSGLAQSIESLFEVLDGYQLMPSHNGIVAEGQGRYRFFGNFVRLSHVFHIITDDLALIQRLTAAIKRNRLRPDYVADCDFAEQAHRDYIAVLTKRGGDLERAEAEWQVHKPQR